MEHDHKQFVIKMNGTGEESASMDGSSKVEVVE